MSQADNQLAESSDTKSWGCKTNHIELEPKLLEDVNPTLSLLNSDDRPTRVTMTGTRYLGTGTNNL